MTRDSQEQIIDEGRELVADQDPVLVDQVVGGNVGIGPAKRLLQWVPLEGRHHMVLCKTCKVDGLMLEHVVYFCHRVKSHNNL